MPVTIGTLKSSVQVTDGTGLNDEMFERVVTTAVARVKEELRRDKDSQADSDVEDRRSDPEPY